MKWYEIIIVTLLVFIMLFIVYLGILDQYWR